jgi:regulation of enolase protein 1 (concanavalin A-like superfamily)
MNLDTANARWFRPPGKAEVEQNSVTLITEPQTDFWQGTYYGFRVANAPALLWQDKHNFTFSVKASFQYAKQFDQCGIILFLDENNWFKASIEHEENAQVRLGSVVTNSGYSDWATTDIEPVEQMYYRLSRRGPDFLLEHSVDGQQYNQMRVFHMMSLGKTTQQMGQTDPPIDPQTAVKFGIYACSPGESSFTARFDQLTCTPCIWTSHPQ